jgi:predicted Na+-dependent transporter
MVNLIVCWTSIILLFSTLAFIVLKQIFEEILMASKIQQISVFLKSQIIIIAVLLGTGLALIIPDTAESLRQTGMTPWLIATVFLCQGLALNPQEKMNWAQDSKITTTAILCSLLIFPCLAAMVLKAFEFEMNYHVGLMLISCMPCTLVSGIVISGLAGGDRRAALFITIGANCAAVLIAPPMIKYHLGATTSIDTVKLMQNLLFTVFIPALSGWSLRRKLNSLLKNYQAIYKYLPVACLATVMFVNTGRQKEAIFNGKIDLVLMAILFSLIIHLSTLGIFYRFTKQMNFSVAQCRSFSICCSQKTLPLTIAIWSETFAKHYPAAIIAAMIYHLVQIYSDGLIARRWSK